MVIIVVTVVVCKLFTLLYIIVLIDSEISTIEQFVQLKLMMTTFDDCIQRRGYIYI